MFDLERYIGSRKLGNAQLNYILCSSYYVTELFTIYAWRGRTVITIVVTISSFVASVAEARVVVCAINTAPCKQNTKTSTLHQSTSNIVYLIVNGTCRCISTRSHGLG